MSEWKKCPIGEVVTLRQGFAINAKSKHYMSKEETSLPLLRIADMKNGTKEVFVKEEIPQRFIAHPEDIIYTRTGNVGLVFRNNYGVMHNNCFSVTPNDADELSRDFLYYALQNKTFFDTANALARGAAQPDLPHTSFNSIEFAYPSLFVQERIAYILSRYDSLIENYQKQIKLLEEAAQRLYKEWFIDLHFPEHENTNIIDGVPEGWEKKKVGEVIAKVPRSKQIPTKDYQNEGAIPIIDQSRDYIAGYTDDIESRVESNEPYIVFGDHTRILKYVPFPFAKGADGTQLIMSNNLDLMPQCLLFTSLVSVDLSNYSYARHFKYLKEEEILVPTASIANAFSKHVAKWYAKIQLNREQLRFLTEARDRLLPKLMSGEIEI